MLFLKLIPYNFLMATYDKNVLIFDSVEQLLKALQFQKLFLNKNVNVFQSFYCTFSEKIKHNSFLHILK